MAVRIQPYSGLSGGFRPDGQSVVLLFHPTHSSLGRGSFCFQGIQICPEEMVAFWTHDGYGNLRFPVCEGFSLFTPRADEVSIKSMLHNSANLQCGDIFTLFTPSCVTQV